jgi:hypothetical protein
MSRINRIRAIENAIERRKGTGEHLDTSNRRLAPDKCGVVRLPHDATPAERRLFEQIRSTKWSMLPPSYVATHFIDEPQRDPLFPAYVRCCKARIEASYEGATAAETAAKVAAVAAADADYAVALAEIGPPFDPFPRSSR